MGLVKKLNLPTNFGFHWKLAISKSKRWDVHHMINKRTPSKLLSGGQTKETLFINPCTNIYLEENAQRKTFLWPTNPNINQWSVIQRTFFLAEPIFISMSISSDLSSFFFCYAEETLLGPALVLPTNFINSLSLLKYLASFLVNTSQ